jgi:hypothetical protein
MPPQSEVIPLMGKFILALLLQKTWSIQIHSLSRLSLTSPGRLTIVQ